MAVLILFSSQLYKAKRRVGQQACVCALPAGTDGS